MTTDKDIPHSHPPLAYGVVASSGREDRRRVATVGASPPPGVVDGRSSCASSSASVPGAAADALRQAGLHRDGHQARLVEEARRRHRDRTTEASYDSYLRDASSTVRWLEEGAAAAEDAISDAFLANGFFGERPRPQQQGEPPTSRTYESRLPSSSGAQSSSSTDLGAEGAQRHGGGEGSQPRQVRQQPHLPQPPEHLRSPGDDPIPYPSVADPPRAATTLERRTRQPGGRNDVSTERGCATPPEAESAIERTTMTTARRLRIILLRATVKAYLSYRSVVHAILGAWRLATDAFVTRALQWKTVGVQSPPGDDALTVKKRVAGEERSRRRRIRKGDKGQGMLALPPPPAWTFELSADDLLVFFVFLMTCAWYCATTENFFVPALLSAFLSALRLASRVEERLPPDAESDKSREVQDGGSRKSGATKGFVGKEIMGEGRVEMNRPFAPVSSPAGKPTTAAAVSTASSIVALSVS